jgi:hypothetical protein
VLFAYGATVSAAFFGYVWVWIGLLAPDSFKVVNGSSYLITFVPAVVGLVILTRWRTLSLLAPVGWEEGATAAPLAAAPFHLNERDGDRGQERQPGEPEHGAEDDHAGQPEAHQGEHDKREQEA